MRGMSISITCVVDLAVVAGKAIWAFIHSGVVVLDAESLAWLVLVLTAEAYLFQLAHLRAASIHLHLYLDLPHVPN